MYTHCYLSSWWIKLLWLTETIEDNICGQQNDGYQQKDHEEPS